MRKQLDSFINPVTQANVLLKAFGFSKVPLLFLSGTKVVHIDSKSCRVEIPFRRVVKNHLGSMYFGALAIGADACVGLLATHKIREQNQKIGLVFKSFQADFLKRAEGHTQFVCVEGEIIDRMIQETIKTGQRVHEKIKAQAFCQNEIVAEFVLELSLKQKS